MKKQNPMSLGNIFLIMLLLVLFGILYVYVTNPVLLLAPAPEKFNSDKNELIPSEKLAVFQGNTLPDAPFAPVNFDDHESLPTVDGTKDAPKSMFMMAFNKCDPSCCPSTYSCSGGCVCMTDNQKNLLGTRGKNNKSASCTGVSEF